MPTRMFKLILALGIISVVCYVFFFNSQTVEIFFTQQKSWKLPLALILITSFCTGIALSALFAFYATLKLQFVIWQKNKREDSLLKHIEQIDLAREELVIGNPENARAILERVLSQDPNSLQARILLADCHLSLSNIEAALAVLEKARVEQQRRVELLLRAAHLYAHLGNFTAAHDNTALILKLRPKNKQALRLVIRSARALCRYTEAIQYQQQLVKLLSGAEYNAELEKLAELEIEYAEQEFANEPTRLRTVLEELRKKYSEYPKTLLALAKLAAHEGDLDTASKLLIKSYQQTYEFSVLPQLANLWLTAQQPDRALSSLNAALYPKGAKNKPEVKAQLFLAALMLKLEMLEQAQTELERISTILLPDLETENAFRILQSIVLKKQSKSEQSFEMLLSTVRSIGGKDSGAFFDTLLLDRKQNEAQNLELVLQSEKRLGEQPNPSLWGASSQ